MRVVSFENMRGGARFGLRLGDWIVDLTEAFARLMIERNCVTYDKAINIAMERMPNSMRNLILREEEGMADLTKTAAYLHENLGKLSRPYDEGLKVLYRSEEARLCKPLEVARSINIGANYNTYLSMMQFVQPYEGTAEVFLKLPQSVIGPEEQIRWPVSAKEVCCELELGVVLGKKGKRIPRTQALDYVFGYTVVNDVTAIDLFKRGLGKGREGLPGFYYLALAKSFDTFEPIGPCLTLKDEIPNPQNLKGELRVNGELKASGNTSDMRLRVAEIIEYISRDITLYPGDLIPTGAMGNPAQIYLKPGDVVEMEIEKIGVLRNYVAPQ